MSEGEVMTLNEFIQGLIALEQQVGPDRLVDVFVSVSFEEDAPVVFGNVQAGEGSVRWALVKRQPEYPLFHPMREVTIIDMLQEYVATAQDILEGLGGQGFRWGEETRRWRSWKARRMGINLITRSFAKDLGLEIPADQRPVGTGLYDWGRKRQTTGELYVMECQARKKKEESQAKEESNPEDNNS